MNSTTITQGLKFVVLVILQVILFKNIVLFDKAFCFAYLAFLIMLPFEIGPLILISLGFITGLSIDLFYDSLGIHAAACVLIMFIRPYWINLLTPQGGYEFGTGPGIKSMGLSWFLFYSFPLLFIHNFSLFYIENSGFSSFFFTLTKVISTTVFTFIILVLGQYLLAGRRLIKDE